MALLQLTTEKVDDFKNTIKQALLDTDNSDLIGRLLELGMFIETLEEFLEQNNYKEVTKITSDKKEEIELKCDGTCFNPAGSMPVTEECRIYNYGDNEVVIDYPVLIIQLEEDNEDCIIVDEEGWNHYIPSGWVNYRFLVNDFE